VRKWSTGFAKGAAGLVTDLLAVVGAGPGLPVGLLGWIGAGSLLVRLIALVSGLFSTLAVCGLQLVDVPYAVPL
jgi:hypothetical protein